ncbi:Lrp/AsnC family transcriptional regulator [Pseudovibrio ascidiaceicola]|jgi:Lrp/AsnC family transcriptional regulator|uniref:Lrp/AsnC family transcriptional regulator n=3 Tax=Pseudovibrio TaxID=258255 RepID=A0A1I6ZQC0_9HYPH|nr:MULTISPECIES: Lrp/AsnC family transcriptional regulator [Pseudovibrio]AEV38538.1 transcriptional regulator, AsnC family [Pseudovibrio sp. FO-BEG1]EEA95728.1 transcriptional regulator, AsnC family [Pseudovibrio sp. JE062]KZL05676.1 Leucine-responsive regulatory protein [Pseudovibrio sp. Ad26]QUS54693.1 Lrp/AsnC family transcriptional regulator [Pseudovibrio brasiliensis]SFK79770.1 Lrp/AsnC family transcriptional regulator [Pseudovibrio ascidiaceicola]
MSENSLLDPSDIRVLRILQKDASQSIADIAKEAGMSQTPCWRRIKKLKETGVIKQTAALVDREAVGLGFLAYAFVKLTVPSRENMETFDRLIGVWPEVVTCERITGAVDYLIKVVATDIKSYDDFLRLKLLDNALVSDVQSRIVVSTIKETVALPLKEFVS